MVNTFTEQTTATPDSWNPPVPPTDLIFDDGESLETNQHRVAMNVLIRSYQQYRAEQTDFFVGGNMFIYYSSTQVKNRDFRGPDFFVVLDVDGERERLGWVVWEEEGRYPDVIVELMSPSTTNVDLGLKKDLYDRVFKTQDYFVYNPFDPTSLCSAGIAATHIEPLFPTSAAGSGVRNWGYGWELGRGQSIEKQ
jgi:Uma2 family endonuclease